MYIYKQPLDFRLSSVYRKRERAGEEERRPRGSSSSGSRDLYTIYYYMNIAKKSIERETETHRWNYWKIVVA